MSSQTLASAKEATTAIPIVTGWDDSPDPEPAVESPQRQAQRRADAHQEQHPPHARVERA